jgi:hypothetical protein
MRFMIRDLLWLIFVAAVGLAWWMHSDRLYNSIRLLEMSVEHEKAKNPTIFRIDGKDQILTRGERTFISVAEDGSIEVATPIRQPALTPKQ